MLLSRLETGEPEIFASIQGEGVTTGVPSVFIRLAECNLKCSYCDTKYTWDWNRFDREKETVEIPTQELLERVAKEASGARNVVITGGEPLLQQSSLVPLASELQARGFRVEIETNGTIQPSEDLAKRIDQWNVSPKLENSANRSRARLRSGPLTWFVKVHTAFFKFVISSESDVNEVSETARRFEIPHERITLMPEGTSAAAIAERSAWLVEHCQKNGFRFSTRLHVLLWGSERGR